jgi:uncharacterized damage-inducible protein DinB
MSATTAAPSLQQAFGQELKNELAITRRLLERVPTDKFDWQPHPKSMPIGKLASHMAMLIGFLDMALQGAETDMAQVQWPQPPADNAEMLSRFDANSEKLHEVLANVEDATFHDKWTMRHGEKVIMSMPRTAVTRVLVLNHLIHHRGQLSVYLRLLDIPVPSIYGPSADENPFG